jgi:predicted  nucleic acid-binding Zn-ribbon protein
MASQETDRPPPQSTIKEATETKNNSPEVDLLDRAGNAILGLVNRAASTIQADLQVAREATERLADQLRVAHDQINKLEAKARYYQDRAERAERWLQHISSEIEQKFMGADDNRSARRDSPTQARGKIRGAPSDPPALSFLRRHDTDRPKNH